VGVAELVAAAGVSYPQRVINRVGQNHICARRIRPYIR